MMGPIKVKVLCGDITKETVEAIVNSTTTSLDLNTAPQPADGVILTTAGNLSNIKHIIHMVGQTNEKGISSSMYKVLGMCEENKIQSVSFPALGTGKFVRSEIQISKAKQRYLDDPKMLNIDRIQSQSQWQRYCVLKQAVDKKYPKQRNERQLYHGTTKEICQKINKNGFNRSFCGRNAVYHGEGTYFAKEAWYSCQDKYSNPDDKELKYIYRARVVTGSLCKSREGMKEPDPINPADPRAGLHDCAVDSLQNPFIFVVFCDAGAYPEYLITFKSI
uniref:Poly [ADP-ribose] polymerase n=1 Tax=Sinocyclocheilus rhinocerous TaxID=307959 RepID=A0A673HF62_9TELE